MRVCVDRRGNTFIISCGERKQTVTRSILEVLQVHLLNGPIKGQLQPDVTGASGFIYQALIG